MKRIVSGRRSFLTGLVSSTFLARAHGASKSIRIDRADAMPQTAAAKPPRIKFGVIGLNHSHINSQTEAVLRGGGELTLMYARERDLAAAFLKRFPQCLSPDKIRIGEVAPSNRFNQKSGVPLGL